MIKIKDVKYESDYFGGCETCDYESSYISNIKILFEDNAEMLIETKQMYEYVFSESDFMKVLTNSNTINEIILNLLNILNEKCSETYTLEERINLEHIHIKINNKEINILKTFNGKEIFYE